jgi:conjugative transposon TraK protein
MFKKMQNIDTAFRYVRRFTLVVVAGSLLLCGFTLYQSYQWVTAAQSQVYVLVNGKALEAYAADRKDNLPVEARDHVQTFHQYFFALDPDEKVIRTNITKALYLADASAKRVYDNLQEKGFYAEIIAGNISQQVTIDSVRVEMNQYPYPFRCYATQSIIRPTSQVFRSLLTAGYLRNVSRSDNNPHGFLIQRWTILENRDLKSQSR